MASDCEHSPRGRAASNQRLLEAILQAGRVLRSDRRDPVERRLAAVLEQVVEATGAERIYLVRSDSPSAAPTVVSSWCTRSDGLRQPSRTTLARAIAHRHAWHCTDAPTSASARRLRLRVVASAPVPGTGAWLVVDSARPERELSDRPADRREASLQVRVGLFAAFVAPLLRSDGQPLAAGRADRGHEADSIAVTGDAPATRKLLSWIERAARTELPVLVHGETGSGKERVARTIHRQSPRCNGAFVAVNCTALTETLLDAELFGACRGAYTGADRDRPGLFRHAERGTLFLDEVGDMPASMQVKLLRALQERRIRPVGGADEVDVDVRVVAATHRDLREEVRRGRFRADLYHRLAILDVRVPPLRERRDDLHALVNSLAPRLLRETGASALHLCDSAWDVIMTRDWPGNVRELHAALARALLRADGAVIASQHFDDARSVRAETNEADDPLEKRMIASALQSAGGSLAEAARSIGWTRQKLYRRIDYWRAGPGQPVNGV